ncbi:hypothetical protein Q5P01_008660 [Channa striata]|uniref:Uncharacterized protein n=1 Tax=Channa striata TaxID=64152 RepID=A0AA88MZS2_CHASR|nr:hypothetical protein Q5P01_008660 [Channa striata]
MLPVLGLALAIINHPRLQGCYHSPDRQPITAFQEALGDGEREEKNTENEFVSVAASLNLLRNNWTLRDLPIQRWLTQTNKTNKTSKTNKTLLPSQALCNF